MEAYRRIYECIINNKKYQSSGSLVLLEKICENTEICINWDNLNDFYSKFGIHLPFSIWNFKKGRVISFWGMPIRDIKEWKEKDFSFTFNTVYKKCENVSINKILDYPEVEKAITYLVERGLKTINDIKKG